MTTDRYELLLRKTGEDDVEYLVGEFNLEARPGEEEGEVDFYDVNGEVDSALVRVFDTSGRAEA